MNLDSLLTTKLHIPRLSMQHVKRPHLLSLLEQGIQGSLTLVAAPAGSGKTTLLTEWALTTNVSVRWLSLEASENDPMRLLSYLLHTFKPISQQLEFIEQEREHISTSAWEPTLIRVLNALTHDLEQDTVLILDDYHHLTSNDAHALVCFLLEHLPPHLHLVVGTRVDPPWALPRLRARNKLCEIRDLGFTTSETHAFARAMGIPLSEETPDLLETATEGWIAGIQLLTLAMRGRQQGDGFLRRAGHVHYFLQEYFDEEILGRQSQEIRHFLLHTCLLERLCGPLCDALLESTGSQQRLADLRKANLFLSALDETETWYRYHPLFAEALQHRLREQEPEHIPELYNRASQWYEAQGWEEEACNYALLAHYQARAALLLEKLMPNLIAQGRFVRLGTWLEQLSPEIIEATPMLFLASCWWQFLRLGIPTEPARIIQQLTRQLNRQIEKHAQSENSRWEGFRQGPVLLQAIKAMMQGDTTTSLSLIQEAAPTEGAGEPDKLLSVMQKIILGNLYGASGHLQMAEQLLLEPTAWGDIPPLSPLNLARLPSLINMYEAQGRLHELCDLSEELLRSEPPDAPRPLILPILVRARYSALLYEWNRLSEAETNAKQALEANERLDTPIPFITFLCLGIQARVALAHGEQDKAIHILSRPEFDLTQYAQRSDQEKRILASIIARIALVSENLALFKNWADTIKITIDDRLAPTLTNNDITASITQARILLSSWRNQHNAYTLAQALTLLERLAEVTARMGFHGWLLEIWIVMAMTLQEQGKARRALKLLGQALTEAENENYVRLFADEGQPMAHLLNQISEYTAASSTYIQRIQSAIQPARLLTSSSTPEPQLPEALSPREREVLALLAQGLSNQQIADRLVISLNTAKRHVKHLLAKFAVTNRTQAIIRARELHLL